MILTKQREFLFSSEPVYRLMGYEFSKKEEKSLKKQVNEFFDSIGNKAKSVFGDVILDERAFKDSTAHGVGRNKAAAFRAIPSILQNGIEVLPMAEHKRGIQSGMIAAPITIADKEYIAVAVIRKDQYDNQRLYVHEVTLKEKILDSASNPAFQSDATQDTNQGSITKVLQKIISAK